MIDRVSTPLLYISGLSLLLISTLIALRYGPIMLSIQDIISVIWSEKTQNEIAPLIINNIRLPRILLAISVGVLLASCGAVLQGLFRNPLADPSIIGISGGSALGAGIAIIVLPKLMLFFPSIATLLPPVWFTLSYSAISAFLCGMLTTFLVYRIGRSCYGTSITMLLLAGVAISAIAFSGLGLLSYLATDQQLRELSLWQMGSLAAARWPAVILATTTAILLLAYFYRQTSALNALLLGESEARYLGFSIEIVKRRLIISCAIGVGVGVAVSGMIGFVGLVIPHLIRLVSGPDYRKLLPLSALWGAILLLLADNCARLIAPPSEIPIGIITALLGAPFFLWLLIQQKRNL